MGKKRRAYTRQFKAEAVRLVTEAIDLDRLTSPKLADCGCKSSSSDRQIPSTSATDQR